MDIQHIAISRTNSLMRFCLLLLSGMLLPLQLFAVPPDFDATYQVETRGIIAAQSTYSLRQNGQTLNLSQHSEAIGFAAFFSDETLHESSSMSFYNGQLLLEKYSFIQRGSNRNRDIQLTIDWDKSGTDELLGEIKGTANEQTIEHTVNQPVWDTLSFQIPVMMTPPTKNNEQQHTMLIKGELKNYAFISHGRETIEVSGNTIETIKIEKNTDNSDRPFYFWIAPELHHLPVKFEKWKDGEPHIIMSLSRARFPADKQLSFDSNDTSDDFDDI